MSVKDPMPLPKMKEVSAVYRRKLRPIEWVAVGANVVVWAWAIFALVRCM